MSTHLEPIPAAIPMITAPQPGAIWQIRGGDRPAPIVMIVQAPIDAPADDGAPIAVHVMLLSQAVQFQSDIDILVPGVAAGDRDLLALTWQVFAVDRADLIQPTGIRWSRAIYDCLLDIGDRHHGLTIADVNPTDQGLVSGPPGSHQQPTIQTFHAEQRTIAQALTQNFEQATHQFYAIQATEKLLEAAVAQTIDLTECQTPSQTPSQTVDQSRPSPWINLSQWCATASASAIDGWDRLLVAMIPPQFVPALRSQPSQPQSNAAAIATLVDRLQTTTDDETLWATVESLWQLDPGNPAAGVRRVKVMDFGMQVAGEAVALAVAIVPQATAMAVLLQVYPSGSGAYLPEDLQLILLDEAGQVLRQINARPADIFIQLKLSGNPGERFSVRVALGESGLTENFVM
jgi:Protein of unknown function (DUF1822)